MKKQPSTKKYKITIAILVVLVVILAGCSIYGFANLKTSDEKEYLAAYPYLLGRHIDAKYGKESRGCEVDAYGVSADGDPYVSFVCKDYIIDEDELVVLSTEESLSATLYFQHRNDGFSDYSEALGYN